MTRTLAAVVAVGIAVCLLAGAAQASVDPGLSCKQKKAKAAGKKAADLTKAFGKNVKKPDAAKLAADISKAQSKFTKAFTKADSGGGCQTTGDSGAIEAKVDAFVLEAIGSISPVCGDDIKAPKEGCDGADDSACPGLCQLNCRCPAPVCGNGVIEGGEQCDPPCEQGGCADGQVCNGSCQCEPVAPCDCGTSEPTQVRFTQKEASGVCGTAKNASGIPVFDLACGGLYIGGGGGQLILPVVMADNATLIHRVECCNGTSLTLGHTTAAETGDRRTCTAGSSLHCSADSTVPGAPCLIDKDCHRCSTTATKSCAKDGDCPATETCITGGVCEACFFGAGPQPIPDWNNLFVSSCLLDLSAKNSTGALDCSTGETFLNYTLDANVHLPGIDYSDEPGWQSCPVCVGGTIGVAGSGLCEGGPNNGLPCEPGNTQTDLHDCCVGDAVTKGRPCSDDSDCGAGSCAIGVCSSFPTSQDCPPSPINNLGAIPVPFELVTGTSTATANAEGSFCGFCRDVDIEGSLCFEGDKDALGSKGCPDSATIACKPESGTDWSECGNGVPCLVDSDCAAPYDTCEQRTPGAFRNATITSMSTVGSPGGDLRDGLPHDATLADVFCIDSSFAPSIDQDSDLPGPGVVILGGEQQLLP